MGNHLSKLTTRDVAMIKYRLSRGESLRALAKDFDVAAGSIQAIKCGDSYHYVATPLSVGDVELASLPLPRRRHDGHPKLGADDVDEIRRLVSIGVGIREVGRRFGVSPPTVRRRIRHDESEGG